MGHQKWSAIRRQPGRQTYRVEVGRDGRWWFVSVPEVRGAHTQARSLDQVEPMAREVVSLLLEVPEDSFDMVVVRVRDELVDTPLT